MANKQLKRGRLFKKLSSLFLLFFFACLLRPSIAQNISKYFTSSIQDSGTLYFIEPPTKFSNKTHQSKVVFDLTYLTTKDSVLLNFSLFKKKLVRINQLHFVQKNNCIQSPVKKIFVDSKNKKWHHRYAVKFSFNDLKQLFRDKQKPSLLLLFSDQSELQLMIKKKKWEKSAELLSRIFALIEANKRE